MSTRAEQEKRVFARIDELEDEMIKVALDLGNIDRDKLVYKDEAGVERRNSDVVQHEKLGAEYVRAWLEENGFEDKRQGAPNRPNILGIYRGTGNGRSVLFNSHLDVGTRLGIELKLREPNVAHRIGAWREDDDLVGQGIVNCKGPMSSWLIMAKALKDTGVQLAGDVLLSSVVGETGGAPVDEFESPQWDSPEVGARYVASHGGIADYVVVAEATGFGIVPAHPGGHGDRGYGGNVQVPAWLRRLAQHGLRHPHQGCGGCPHQHVQPAPAPGPFQVRKHVAGPESLQRNWSAGRVLRDGYRLHARGSDGRDFLRGDVEGQDRGHGGIGKIIRLHSA